MKVLHCESARFGPETRRLLEDAADVDWIDCTDEAALVEALTANPYDALFVRVGLPVRAAALDAAPALRWVVTPTTGLDHIDLVELERREISLISLRGELHLLRTVHATAEHTWALLLSTVRRLPSAHSSVQAGTWEREPFVGTELYGRTLGVIGHGRLGSMVASYGVAFGMNVVVHELDPENRPTASSPIVSVDLEELLASADVISLHLPLDEDTQHFLGPREFGMVKRGAILVNTARGELVDDDAFLDALRSGRLAGAGLDVVSDDSNWPGVSPPGHAIIEYARANDNLVITPHIGGYAIDAITSTRHHVTRRFIESARVQEGRQ